MSPIDRVLGALEGKGNEARGSGEGWVARCPAHEDSNPSLSITRGEDARVLLHCHAGCTVEAIVQACGLQSSDLFERTTSKTSTIVATYDYRDEAGVLLFQVVRSNPKKFWQRRPDGHGGWIAKVQNVRRVPYRLPQFVTAAANGGTVFVVEGEKDVDNLESLGLFATCNAGGAEKWRKDFGRFLAGADVVVLPDNDEPGRRHGEQVVQSVHEHANRVVTVTLPGLAEKGDVSDWLAAGGDRDQLQALVDSARSFIPAEAKQAKQPKQGRSEGTSHVSASANVSPTETEHEFEDGSALMDEVASFIKGYIVFPSVEDLHAVALWALHTHAFAAFESTPRLAILSPIMQCGKTRTYEVLELLVRDPLRNTNTSVAVLSRVIQSRQPTVLIDEVDAIFGPQSKGDREDLRAIINAGHRRGSVVMRCGSKAKNFEPEAFDPFTPMALAGIGKLPDTVMDRSIVITMRRKSPSEKVRDFRRRQAENVGLALGSRMANWATPARLEALANAEPEMPAGITDRPADVWEPIIALGDELGPVWSTRARQAATVLSGSRKTESSVEIELLADIRAIFDTKPKRNRLSSAEIVAALLEPDSSRWADLRGQPIDARQLARMLKPFQVKSGTMRILGAEGGPVKGYIRADFEDAWSRYLPDVAAA